MEYVFAVTLALLFIYICAGEFLTRVLNASRIFDLLGIFQ